MKRICLLVICLFTISQAFFQVEVYDLKCQYINSPERVDENNPRLYWKLKSNENGQLQTAHRIIVASSSEQLAKKIGYVYDSKRVKSLTNSHINHFVGFVDNYLVRHVSSLDINPSVPGHKEIIFQPRFIDDLNFSEASYQSINGMAGIHWKRINDSIEVSLTVPCNNTGKLILPNEVAQVVDENNQTLKLSRVNNKKQAQLKSGTKQLKLLS